MKIAHIEISRYPLEMTVVQSGEGVLFRYNSQRRITYLLLNLEMRFLRPMTCLHSKLKAFVFSWL